MRNVIEPTFNGEKKPPADLNSRQTEVLVSLKNITSELESLNSHKLIKTYNSLHKLLFLHFLKGIVFGLGTVLGATIVVTILAYILSQFEFIPIIGEWVKLIAEEIKT